MAFSEPKTYQKELAPVGIIGGGPAGLMTALYLSEKGIPSVVLEKDTFPKSKACGDIISGLTIRALQEIDPGFIGRFKDRQVVAPLRGTYVYAPNGHALKVDYLPLEKGGEAPSCYAITREDFDHYLFQLANADPNITIREGVAVKGVETGASHVKFKGYDGQCVLKAKLSIVATGSNHFLPKKLQPKKLASKHTAVGIRAYFEGVELPRQDRFSELWVIKNLMPGGLYLTPLPNGLVNVNVGMRKDVVLKNGVNLNQLLFDAIQDHPNLRDRFKHATLVGKIKGSNLNLGTYQRNISGERLLMVGDAAGLIDLLSANGLPQAIASAKIAADQADDALKSNNFSAAFLKPYDQKVFDRVDHYLKLGKIIAPIMTSPVFKYGALTFLSLIAKYFDKNDALRGLMYDNQISKTLRKPSFYLKVLFGAKHAEGMKS